jgi:hypothetical protein
MIVVDNIKKLSVKVQKRKMFVNATADSDYRKNKAVRSPVSLFNETDCLKCTLQSKGHRCSNMGNGEENIKA